MKNQFKKGLLATLGMMLMLTIMSCNAKPSNDNLSNESISDDNFSEAYLLCNATSWGNMAEIESGFYFLDGSQLMYADRDDMSNWVAVCNKPDCPHKRGEDSCNANISSEITQKDDKLYFYKETGYPTQGYICQVEKDGSEASKVFEVPLNYTPPISSRAVLSQEGFFMYFSTLEEDGWYTKAIYRLEEDGSMHTLFSKKYEADFGVTTMPAYHSGIRGEFTLLSSLLAKEEGIETNIYNVLFRMDGDEPERVDLPEDVSTEFTYLGKDTFIYYKQGEGFFEIDLETQTETCIMKNQLSDARGYTLTEDYMIECNRYNGYMPDEAFMKFYDGTKWIDVQLPELVSKTDCYFTPTSVATDRIFFTLMKNGIPQLYYFMLNEENPTLTLATTFGDETVFEVIESDVIHEVDVTIFETEQYTVKLTEVGFGLTTTEEIEENAFGVTIYLENKTDKILNFYINDVSINGVSYLFGRKITAKPYETVEKSEAILFHSREVIDYKRKLTSFLFNAWIKDEKNEQLEPRTIIEVYPYGEENVEIQEVEALLTGDVLIDNEFIRLTAIEYWEREDKSAMVKFIVENKTDSIIICTPSEITSINGQMLNRLAGGDVAILPQSYGYLTNEMSDECIKKYEEIIGDEVKEYSINFKIYKQSLMTQEPAQVIFEETVLLSPKR